MKLSGNLQLKMVLVFRIFIGLGVIPGIKVDAGASTYPAPIVKRLLKARWFRWEAKDYYKMSTLCKMEGRHNNW